MIEMIRVDNLYPHPDNPRKEVGDVAELAESIKESGILQNLTVVPWDSNVPEWGEEEQRYRVIIGHRRLAAAKMAGLDKVPCSIAKMDRKTQLATMLLENMQRVDLTLYEQAQGFQMMMDLGESLRDISEKTGFSETTVRRRVKLLELDQERLKESEGRGGTLMDYMEISKIKDIEQRNEVLDHIGTNNFKWKYEEAIRDQEKEEIKKKLIEKVEVFARNIEDLDQEEIKTNYVDHFQYTEDALEKEIEVEGDREYLYKVDRWYIEILEDVTGQDKESDEERLKREEDEAREALNKARKAKIEELEGMTEKLREDFVYSLTNGKVKPLIDEIVLLAIETNCYFYISERDFIKTFKLDTKVEDFNFEEVKKIIKDGPELSLLKILYEKEFKNLTYFSYSGSYLGDKLLDKVYDLLEKLGYELSEEEMQIRDGNHELYVENS